ncbi:PREDICTED: uncharacterized protein LOC106751158 [Dinoponera quadriceps]|uniref:Uncharacterized protein LOC106751158 n=1 Tax=Dinoponera quadriceps TaxID=609295 RepID=A0A6P3Y979_DINQU|nr:PREDICTED: uncharacterized protein LOC106751158 [Dinoponera quadriceps]
MGIWSYSTNNRLLQKLEKIPLISGIYVLLILELVSMLLYVFMVLKGTRARIKVMATMLFTIVSILKYSNLIYAKDQMRCCMARVEEDFRDVVSPAARNTMLFHARTGRRLFVLCGIFMYSSGMTYRTLIPLSRGKIVIAQNVTIRPLPSPAHYVLFDPQISPAYEIMFFVQCFTGLIKYTITVAACGIAALFTMHVVAQLDILVMLMNNLTNERELENVNRKLSVIVEHHIRTRNLLHMVQKVLQYSSLIEVTTCTSMLCLILYYVIMEWEASNTIAMCTYFIIVVSLTFNIFVYCFIGEQLSEKGEQVALTACTLDWHFLPDTKARALILIMLMSNTPMRLKAGNFIDLSFRTFGVWPYYRSTNYWFLQKLEKFALVLGIYVLLVLELVSMLLYVFMVVKGTQMRIKVMATMLFTIVSILKYSNFIYAKDQMRCCMARVEEDFRDVVSPAARNTMLFYARTGRRLFILCGIFMYSYGMTIRMLIPLSRGKIVISQNVTIRPLPNAAHYVLFDPQISPAYEIVFFVQYFTGLMKYTITVAACGIAALFTMHIVAQLDILVMLMNNLANEHELENVNRKLSVIVEHHIRTRK